MVTKQLEPLLDKVQELKLAAPINIIQHHVTAAVQSEPAPQQEHTPHTPYKEQLAGLSPASVQACAALYPLYCSLCQNVLIPMLQWYNWISARTRMPLFLLQKLDLAQRSNIQLLKQRGHTLAMLQSIVWWHSSNMRCGNNIDIHLALLQTVLVLFISIIRRVHFGSATNIIQLPLRAKQSTTTC